MTDFKIREKRSKFSTLIDENENERTGGGIQLKCEMSILLIQAHQIESNDLHSYHNSTFFNFFSPSIFNSIRIYTGNSYQKIILRAIGFSFSETKNLLNFRFTSVRIEPSRNIPVALRS